MMIMRQADSASAESPVRRGAEIKPASFLCGHCKRAMCADCEQIAEEYQELYENQKLSLSQMEWRMKQAEEEAAKQKRRAESLDAVLKCGIHPLMLAWVDSLSPSQLQDAVEKKASV